MHRDGRRELLIYDPVISSGQQVALKRSQPLFHRSAAVDEHKAHGRFYVQNIDSGPGFAGVQPGAVKRIRVVGLDYRAKGTVALGLHPRGFSETEMCVSEAGKFSRSVPAGRQWDRGVRSLRQGPVPAVATLKHPSLRTFSHACPEGIPVLNAGINRIMCGGNRDSPDAASRPRSYTSPSSCPRPFRGRQWTNRGRGVYVSGWQ